MTGQENTKVYELAKELGLDSISLVDKLNGLNIKVKNHMSELEPSQLETARNLLGKKAAGSKTAATKSTATRTRKKATTAVAAEVAAPTTPTASAAATAGASASAATVIRRRSKADGSAAESVVSQATAAESKTSAADSAIHAESATETFENETDTQAYSGSESAQSEAEHEAATPVEDTEEWTQEPSETVLANESVEEAAPVQATGATAAGPATVAPMAPRETTMEAPATTIVTPSVQKAPLLPPRPVAPRRSILKIVEAATPIKPNVIKAAPPAGPAAAGTGGPGRPAVRGTATQDKDGFRIIRMTKENLDQMAEEEAAKKRGGGGKVPEINPEDVRFADYRKKEMVFLPKKKRLPVGRELKRTEITKSKAIKRVVEMHDTIVVSDFANQMNVKAGEVIKKLMMMGQMATINQTIDFDTATILGSELGYEVRNVAFKEAELLETKADTSADLVNRPPVVTIMGHVDHGKTSLLDVIREANVAGGEAGGITQHIGAYTVEKDGKMITFIDTPGHEAFSVMRARGANVTDIVILVVAADDGVMPQTREALAHAKAAGVPIIVAMNKMDKPAANPEKIKQQLAELDLLAEDWGGQSMFVPVSAAKKTGIDELLQAILLQSEVLELKANADTRAEGNVLEARIVKGRGPVVSLLVKRGTLRVGDPLIGGQYSGRVKALTDHLGKTVQFVSPGMAAEVLGFEALPNAGEPFYSPASDEDAKTIAEHRQEKTRGAPTAASKMSLDALFAKIQSGTMKELPIVLKADVFGSVEAIRDSLLKLSNEKVKVKILLAAPGGITESDVLLASASNALIIGFNIRPETKARQVAEAAHIEIQCYNIIYELIDEVRKAMSGLLDKKKVEKYLGRAEVRQTFTVPKIGVIAGSSVVDGKILRGANVRLLRESRVIYEGKMHSLKRFKDDAKEVAQGFECGIGLENYNDLKPGDLIEAYQIELVAQEL